MLYNISEIVSRQLLSFNKGLNVLIGENDSGKSAIIDAIKLVLKTHSYEWIKIEQDDFFGMQERLRIELIFEGFSDDEAKNFTEWLGWFEQGDDVMPNLKVILDVKRSIVEERIYPSDVRAGADVDGQQLSAEAKDYLKVTYLKPLRDVESELIPKKNSRLSQILFGHDAFKGIGVPHHLMQLSVQFNQSIEKYFEGKNHDDSVLADQKGKDLKTSIDQYIQSFYEQTKESGFSVINGTIKQILEKLELSIKDEINPGLGTLNRLFMASELLHLNKTGWTGLRLGLIEELEAHLHPQAQMQIIEALQEQESSQLILTTHSPNIGSKVKLKNLVICSKGNAFPLGDKYTKLSSDDYSFLERFLDNTKANFFFAKGVILVEGWGEELLLPALAKKYGINLTEKGVSIVNIANTAFLRYANIFKRILEPYLEIPVAIITDVDVKPSDENSIDQESGETILIHQSQAKINSYTDQYVKVFVSPHWTLEYCLALCEGHFGELFYAALQKCRPIALADDYATYTAIKARGDIALDLYMTHIKAPKLKSIFAQQLAQNIENDGALTPAILESYPQIKYLLDAIKYATRC